MWVTPNIFHRLSDAEVAPKARILRHEGTEWGREASKFAMQYLIDWSNHPRQMTRALVLKVYLQ